MPDAYYHNPDPCVCVCVRCPLDRRQVGSAGAEANDDQPTRDQASGPNLSGDRGPDRAIFALGKRFIIVVWPPVNREPRTRCALLCWASGIAAC